MSGAIACLFPAFGMKYEDCCPNDFAPLRDGLAEYAARAATVVAIERRMCQRPAESMAGNSLHRDLQEHYVSYVENCAIGNWLKRRGVVPDFLAGYSMGLFAVLHQAGAVSFEDGLRLMQHVCTLAHEAVANGCFSMAAVVGFTPEEIGQFIAVNGVTAEISDVCGPRAVIASGPRADLERLLEICKEEGSLQEKLLPVSVPFHSSFLRLVEPRVREFLGAIRLTPPQCGVVSCIDQEVLSSVEDLREEIASNVWRPMGWYPTINRMIGLGASVFVECGFSESLCKMARHIRRDMAVYHPKKFDQLFRVLGIRSEINTRLYRGNVTVEDAR